MKKIEAIIQPRKLETVRTALDKIGIKGLSVTDIDGYGHQKGHTELYRGQEYAISFTKKVKLEIFTSDDKVEEIVNTIIDTAKTSTIGDGKIFVLPLDEAYRIRTGERGENAL
ncbi:MAG: P-II family nitrogen regulator [Spirochaetota bacterium]|nr:P-II family nitrogen regulator [Spirochaetota bacterium]